MSSHLLFNRTTIFNLSTSYKVINSGLHHVFVLLIFPNCAGTTFSWKGHLVTWQFLTTTQVNPALSPHKAGAAILHHRLCSVPQL